jgi:hypothetical protein
MDGTRATKKNGEIAAVSEVGGTGVGVVRGNGGKQDDPFLADANCSSDSGGISE